MDWKVEFINYVPFPLYINFISPEWQCDTRKYNIQNIRKVQVIHSGLYPLCTMVHFWSARIFSKTSTTCRADFLAIGTAQAVLLKTSMQVSKYLIPSRNDDRLDRSTSSIWKKSHKCLSNVLRVEKRILLGLCNAYMSWPARSFFTSCADRLL